jgi:hypothetical protein
VTGEKYSACTPEPGHSRVHVYSDILGCTESDPLLWPKVDHVAAEGHCQWPYAMLKMMLRGENLPLSDNESALQELGVKANLSQTQTQIG